MRLPNPRVLIPVLLAAGAGGVVGYFVTAASCAPRSCLPAAVGLSLVVAIVSGIGVGVVVVLAVRSFAEWRVHTEREVLVMEEPTEGRAVSYELTAKDELSARTEDQS